MVPRIRALTPLLQVFSMSQSLTFYCDVLGFSILATSSAELEPDWVMLQRDDSTLMLNTAYERDKRPPEPESARIASHGDTALFFRCDDTDAVYAHLKSVDWPAREPFTTSYGMRQVYTKDPDGFEICFQHPAPPP